MFAHELLNYTGKVIELINNIEFEEITQRTPYYHMGATIVDSVLQAGLNYKTVVYPRVLKLLTSYPMYTTTCDFIILMQTIPLQDLISWKSKIKIDRIVNLTWFLQKHGVENEDQLAKWIGNNDNLLLLLSLQGVGPKTVDYLKMLSGIQAIAVDRHLFKFLELAGIVVKGYNEARDIYHNVASRLNLSEYELDKKIWTYMAYMHQV